MRSKNSSPQKKRGLKKALAKRLAGSAGILFSALLVFTAIVYAVTWAPGGPPQAAPGDGNVELPGDTDTRCDTSGQCSQVCIGSSCKTSWPSAGINGSGTTNYLSKWTAGTTLGNSTIFDNGNVGIGTASPAQKLHVAGTARVDGAIVSPEGTLRDDGGGWVRTYGSTGWYNQSYGGGWYMTDTSWIRSYNSKSVYTGSGIIRSDASVRAPIFYDQDNTGYYVNPNGTNRLNYIHTDSRMRIGFDGINYFHLRANNGEGADMDQILVIIRSGVSDYKFHFRGTIYANAKNFKIDHPLDPKNKSLVHSSLEGPEIAVFYRGGSKLVDGQAIIKLPDYFEALTREEDRTVILTAKNGWSPLYVDGDLENGKFVVKTTEQGSEEQEFYWEVKAVRADIEPLEVEIEK